MQSATLSLTLIVLCYLCNKYQSSNSEKIVWKFAHLLEGITTSTNTTTKNNINKKHSQPNTVTIS